MKHKQIKNVQDYLQCIKGLENATKEEKITRIMEWKNVKYERAKTIFEQWDGNDTAELSLLMRITELERIVIAQQNAINELKNDKLNKKHSPIPTAKKTPRSLDMIEPPLTQFQMNELIDGILEDAPKPTPKPMLTQVPMPQLGLAETMTEQMTLFQ